MAQHRDGPPEPPLENNHLDDSADTQDSVGPEAVVAESVSGVTEDAVTASSGTGEPSLKEAEVDDDRATLIQAREDFEDRLHQVRDDIEDRLNQARDHFDQANAKIKQRTGRNLIGAIVIGVLAGLVLLGSLLFIKELFIPIALALALLAVVELSRALRDGGRRIDLVPQLIGTAAVVLSGYFAPLTLVWFALIIAVALVTVWRALAQMSAQDHRPHQAVLLDMIAGGFVQAYVGFLIAMALVLLRQEGGQWWVLSFMVVVVAADTGAYASGLSFGKHPMAPRISPKKTWEGFAGAGLAALIAGVLLGLFLLGLPWWAGAIFGLVIMLTATLGDLAESMIKRDLDIKDMSSWVPGHGGVLDRLDSMLPSSLVALGLFWLLSPVVGL